MPKIDVYKKSFFNYLGRECSDKELERLLEVAKAELDDVKGDMYRIELNDTNRPDLWSAVGLARQLRSALDMPTEGYDFFSSAGHQKPHDNRVVRVDKKLEHSRPYIAAFAFSGPPIQDELLKDLVQIQEKLTENYGRKRSVVAMGIYRSDLVYPVEYRAAAPDSESFQPLGSEKTMSLQSILNEHPKGKEYAYVVEKFSEYPLIHDAKSKVLSFPPIINSADLGKVEVGDTALFLELTGTNLQAVLLCCSIVACAVADMSYTIYPVQIQYPYDTEYGRSIVTPFYFQPKHTARLEEIDRFLGKKHNREEVALALKRMGVSAELGADGVEAIIPPYRNDYLHAVDIIEDVMIGNGLDSYKPQMPKDFTIGRITPMEGLSRKVKSIMVGQGYQEMIFNYMGSRNDYIEKIYPQEEWGDIDAQAVSVLNPLSESFEYIRFSILPCLLGAEAVSANAVYPHQICEVGKVALVDPKAEDGVSTKNNLGFLNVSPEANFNTVHQELSILLYYLGTAYTVCEGNDSRFITGRCAKLMADNEVLAIFGELHPRILAQWGIQVPAVFAELCLDMVL